MSHEAILFFVLTLVSIMIQAFFSMMEMASVSFNKVRLQYYVSKGVKKAKWLNALLNNPTRLFGTTLLGVNGALQFGSECSRRFYSAMGLSPDWAPLSQIFLVVIFAELAPMFAARSYAENVALLGIRVLYGMSLLMRPFVWLIELLFKFINLVFRTSPRKYSFLTRDELQRAIEARGEKKQKKGSEFDHWVASLYATKNKIAKDFLVPLHQVDMIPAHETAADVKKRMRNHYCHYMPVYKERKDQIIGIISPRDLLRVRDDEVIEAHVKRPWFIPMKSSIFEIIREFRWNNQEIAMVIDERGKVLGMISLDHTVAEVLPETRSEHIAAQTAMDKRHILIDRTFPESARLIDICEQYHIIIPTKSEEETLEDLMEDLLNHQPGLGESVIVGDFELKVVGAPLIGEKMIAIRSL